MKTSKEEIQILLKKINYPGFSRDIISFGMVKNISIDDSTVSIKLQINSNNTEKNNELKSNITKVFQNAGLDVKINIENKSDQPQNNNQLQQTNIKGIKNIIAIASGKGGVGKSTIALNLATALSNNYKVGLLDLDIYGPSLPMLTGITQQPTINQDNKLIPISKFGMQLMSFGFINSKNSPTIWRGPMVSRMTTQFFEDVAWEKLDYLILDLPPGTGDIQLTLVQKLAITGAIIITTPQDLAVLDVKKGADMFKKVNTPILGVIENMTHFLCPHCNNTTQIFSGTGGKDESSRLNVPLLGKIFLTDAITKSCDAGTPFILENKTSPITNSFYEIANKINLSIGNLA